MDSFNNPDDILKQALLPFQIFGLWTPKSGSILIYRLRGIAFLIFTNSVTFFILVHLFMLEDYSQLSSALWGILPAVCQCIKCVYIFSYNSELQQLIDPIRQFQLKSIEESLLVKNRMSLIYKFAVSFIVTSVGGSSLKEWTAPMNTEPTLPYYAWLPFWDWKNSRRDYWLAWSYQTIGINAIVIMILSTEILFGFMLYVVSIQLEIIGNRLRNIGHSLGEMTNADEATKTLLHCIKIHIRTLEFKEKIQNYMNFPYVCHLMASGILISAIVNDLVMVCFE